MKFSKKSMIGIWLLALVPLVVTAMLYPQLPAEIPMHWDFQGNVRYDPKASIWMPLLLAPIFALLFPFLAKIDPRKQNYEKFSQVYESFAMVMMLFLAGVNGMILVESLRPGSVNVAKVVPIGCGLLFAWIGNRMPKIRSNFFFGIKTPWTIANPVVWERTNRLGGYCFFFGGIAMALLTFFLPQRFLFALFLTMTLGICLPPTIMSYVWYRQTEGE